MKKLTDIFKVLRSDFLNCSVNGNPKKRLVLEDPAGNVYVATTATDALCGYYGFVAGCKYFLTYHYTRNGSMIIDYYNEI